MYYNSNLYDEAKARQQDHLRAAEQRRLWKQAQTGQPGAIARQLNKLGSSLIKLGEQLQQKPAPQNNGTPGWVES